MAGKNRKKKSAGPGQVAIQNRKARHNYHIEETLEAGIVLVGSEVKSLRLGQGSILEAYARDRDGEMYLLNAHIPEYSHGNVANHAPMRERKLLLHKREIARLLRDMNRGGMTVVPLSVYFNDRGMVKVQLGVAKGKRQYDKRQTEKARDWQRDKQRLLRGKG